MAQRCQATAKATGTQCGRYAIEGGKTCHMHGSANPRGKAAARRRIALQNAEAAVSTLGLPHDISPTEALLEEVRWTAGHVRWLRARVQALDETETIGQGDGSTPSAATRHPLVWGVSEQKEKTGGDDWGTTTTESAAPSLWYQLYERERKHLVTVCAAAIKAGVEERRVALAEAQGQLVGDVIAGSLGDLLTALVARGLTDELQRLWGQLVTEIVPRRLRALSDGSAA